MSNVHSWDESFFYVKIKEDEPGVSKANRALAETRRMFQEEEARKKNQAANPQPDTGKRPMEMAIDPPLKKRRPNTIGSTKIMADAIKSAKPTEKVVQMAKPDIGGYWSAKFGVQGTFENESLLNDLDEALGQVGEVQKDYDQIPESIHVHKGKSELLSLYARLRTLENGVLQNVANRATIEKLEKEIANDNSTITTANANLASATAALVLRDGEIQNLKAKIASDAKSHEDALGEAEYTAGEHAFFYGEMLMAYFSLAHPEIDFTDPEFAVPEPEDVARFKKMPNAKEYLRNYVRKWMKGTLPDAKPSTTVVMDDLQEMPSKADSEQKGDNEVSLEGGSLTVEKKDPQASIGGEGSTKEDAPIII
ncbi:uncharacterized protein [Euphorbia lathyris]|uniref:uncharacterized protein n=1 Tax=Euphorbia lathyris TaxID=212925 RepID=UPI003313C5CF